MLHGRGPAQAAYQSRAPASALMEVALGYGLDEESTAQSSGRHFRIKAYGQAIRGAEMYQDPTATSADT